MLKDGRPGPSYHLLSRHLPGGIGGNPWINLNQDMRPLALLPGPSDIYANVRPTEPRPLGSFTGVLIPY